MWWECAFGGWEESGGGYEVGGGEGEGVAMMMECSGSVL